MTRDQPYEDDSFIEIQMLPSAQGGELNGFIFLIRHKGSENTFEVIAKDRDELAARIAAGHFEDVDPRNDRSPANLDEDATDE